MKDILTIVALAVLGAVAGGVVAVASTGSRAATLQDGLANAWTTNDAKAAADQLGSEPAEYGPLTGASAVAAVAGVAFGALALAADQPAVGGMLLSLGAVAGSTGALCGYYADAANDQLGADAIAHWPELATEVASRAQTAPAERERQRLGYALRSGRARARRRVSNIG